MMAKNVGEELHFRSRKVFRGRFMRIMFARHNGIGDICMAIPFMAVVAHAGHEVHFMTDPSNVNWCRQIMPFAQSRSMDMNPYADHRLGIAGYDAYVNFNNVEQVDYYTELMGVPVPIRQVLYLALTRQHGLPVPAQFSPGRFVERPVVPKSEAVMVFSKAAGNVSRTLLPNVVEDIVRVYPDAVVDPTYPDKWDLFRAIAGARLVVSTESGPYHIAETVGTPWRALYTTFSPEVLSHFYESGKCLQSSVSCSPCHKHSGCLDIQCTGRFDNVKEWLIENDPVARELGSKKL